MVDKTKNPVAKYARKFNKAVVMTDRKKAAKKGDRKHKGQYEEASVDESLTTAQKERQLASLRLKQANQRVQMTKKHQREKEIVANESIEEAKAPSTIRFKGKKYYSTGKQGKDIKTGAPSFEYSSDMDGNDERVFYNTKTRKITRESVEQVDEASQVLIKKMQQLAGGPDKMPRGAEFRALKHRAQDELKKDTAAKKAAPAQKTTSKTSKGKTQTGSADPADRNLIMQLRKAQDVDGKMDIQVSPTGKTIRLPKKQIDALLKKHDSLGKPVDKRKFKIMLTKALRAKAK